MKLNGQRNAQRSQAVLAKNDADEREKPFLHLAYAVLTVFAVGSFTKLGINLAYSAQEHIYDL